MTPLVLLPGMMCDARLFAPQVEALGGSRGVIVPPASAHDSMAGMADAVLEHAPPRFALGGLSMGGILAMEICARAPERVARIALMDTNPLKERPEIRERREPQIAAALSGGLARVMREEMKPNYLAEGPGRQAILDLCMVMALDLGPEVFCAQSRALRDRPDYTGVLRRLDCPALVLCGAGDRLCPPARHEMMAGLIPGAVLEIVPGAGHLPPLEAPDETTAALRRWLEA